MNYWNGFYMFLISISSISTLTYQASPTLLRKRETAAHAVVHLTNTD